MNLQILWARFRVWLDTQNGCAGGEAYITSLRETTLIPHPSFIHPCPIPILACLQSHFPSFSLHLRTRENVTHTHFAIHHHMTSSPSLHLQGYCSSPRQIAGEHCGQHLVCKVLLSRPVLPCPCHQSLPPRYCHPHALHSYHPPTIKLLPVMQHGT